MAGRGQYIHYAMEAWKRIRCEDVRGLWDIQVDLSTVIVGLEVRRKSALPIIT